MVNRQLLTGKKAGIVYGVLAILVALILYLALRGDSVLTLAEMHLQVEKDDDLLLHTGEAWVAEEKDGEGFAPALENDSYAFLIHPETTQIIVRDKISGHEWRSNPREEQLAEETVKGLLLANLSSPFILEYFQSEGSDKARREITNATNKNLEKTFIRYEDGLQLTYTLTDLQLKFSIQYELTEHGLRVSIPKNGVEENGGYAFYSLDILPYFGAARAGEEGYIFVPDGPGGLIRYDANRSSLVQGYVHQVYGREASNSRTDLYNTKRRTRVSSVAYPVFGVKFRDQAFLTILGEGSDSTFIKAMPPGLKSTYYNVNASYIFREEYLRRQSRTSDPVRMVEKSMLSIERTMEFRFLRGEQANYTGMAHAYQDYLLETGRLGPPLSKTEHIPLDLMIMGGDSVQAFNRNRYIATTTFPQAEEMVETLKAGGVDNIRVIYNGWQDGGWMDQLRPLPIESSLGGEKAAKSFVRKIHELNGTVLFENNFTSVTPYSSSSPKKDGVRGIDGTVFYYFWGDYLLKPELTVGYAYDLIDKLKKIGVDGILYNWLGEVIFRDYDASRPQTRDHTAKLYQTLIGYTKEQLGQSGVYQGNEYSLKGIDQIMYFPMDSNYDLMVDETVPFYPIALHGYVSYSGRPGNLRDDRETEFLQSIEYGAVPSFFLTYERSRLLKDSPSDFLFSSEFALWKDKVIKEYHEFDKLASVWHQKIMKHEKQSENVRTTTYEDGTRVIVDYGRKTFEVVPGGKP